MGLPGIDWTHQVEGKSVRSHGQPWGEAREGSEGSYGGSRGEWSLFPNP
jgi:hypothetical protein